MKYLRKQILSTKTIPGHRSIYIDQTGETTIDTSYTLLLPKGTTAQRSADTTSPTYINGMIRYNNQTDEFEGYQDGAWRSFRFKEPGNINLQTMTELGDGSTLIFGPLNPNPLSYTAQSDVTLWDLTQAANNLVVLVENVFQIPNVNYVLVQNPAGDYGGNPGIDMPDGIYIQFGTAVPANKPVYVIHGFDR
jgi:hypothetical protein